MSSSDGQVINSARVPVNLAELDDGAMQDLTAEVIKEMVMRLNAEGHALSVIASKDVISPTEVMMFASALLKAADLAVFELGLWQSWGIGERSY